MPTHRNNTHLPHILPFLFIVLVVAIIGFQGLHGYLSARALAVSDTLVASYKAYRTRVAYPVHIRIGETISIPVTEVDQTNVTYPASSTTAGHLHASALPGEEGNTIIFGTTNKSVFGLLPTMRVGDPVAVRTSDGNLHTYSITEVQTVNPTQTDLLAPTSSEVLTLYTPTGLLDSQRLIMRAEPIKLTITQ